MSSIASLYYLFDTTGIFHCKIYLILKLDLTQTLEKESRIIIKLADGPMWKVTRVLGLRDMGKYPLPVHRIFIFTDHTGKDTAR